MYYKYETHCHTSEASLCAYSSAAEMVKAYYDASYSGIVITDHFVHGNTAVDRNLPWEERAKAYYQAYLNAKEAADELDFDVIFGLEHAYGSGKELLCYGVDLEFLLENPDIPELDVDEFAKRVHNYGGIIIQAHPYRDRFYIDMSVEPRLDIVDGIEICNSANKIEENVKALALLEKGDFIATCGSDTHCIDIPKERFAGIAFPYRIRDGKELVKSLKRRDHIFVIQNEIVTNLSEENL